MNKIELKGKKKKTVFFFKCGTSIMERRLYKSRKENPCPCVNSLRPPEEKKIKRKKSSSVPVLSVHYSAVERNKQTNKKKKKTEIGNKVTRRTHIGRQGKLKRDHRLK